jgi:predicted PurR-regulated permease PerM
MSRWISMIVLLAVIAVTSVVLYRVMAAFLLPLFLAAVLTVIFRPLHARITTKLPGRAALAALLTTCVILLTVLLPLIGVATLAIREALGAISGDVLDRAEVRLARLREHFDLDLPFRMLPDEAGGDPVALFEIDRLVHALPGSLPEPQEMGLAFREQLDALADGLQRLHQRLIDMRYLATVDTSDADDSTDMRRVKSMLERYGDEAFDSIGEILQTVELTQLYANQGADAFPRATPFHSSAMAVTPPVASQPAAELTDTESPVGEGVAEADESDRPFQVADLRRHFRRIGPAYTAFRIDLLGGPFWSWLTDMANPSSEQLDTWRENLNGSLRGLIPSVAGQATAMVGSSLLGFAILGLSMFYFLRDGPAMVQTLMRLSPLDDRYEQELVGEFAAVSRAVVLATLLSALAQGLLAGVAYAFAGFDSLFLLASLTIVFAMIPFVGAAAVWFPACLWLALVEERYLAASLLFVYCTVVVSMIDNLIKPLVLHGQSKLHPLLALLSVLGGVQALGPIGILVGPMVVSFLQALLNILHHELQSFEKTPLAAR